MYREPVPLQLMCAIAEKLRMFPDAFHAVRDLISTFYRPADPCRHERARKRIIEPAEETFQTFGNKFAKINRIVGPTRPAVRLY